MSKARPIPDSIEATGRGVDFASCHICGGRITRVTTSRDLAYPWWHVRSGRTVCMEGKN